MDPFRGRAALCAAMFACLTIGSVALATDETAARGIYRGLQPVAKFDVSPPLRDIPPRPFNRGPEPMFPATADPESEYAWLFKPGATGVDPVVQWDLPTVPLIPAPTLSFNAQANIANVSPPDPVGDVGPNHYVAMSNLHIQVFNKSGVSVLGPITNNTLWAGFGGPCETENAGDPIVLHDQFANRWILTQFTAAGPSYFNCVAVSTTADPTGTYFRYAFTTGTNFPDYPKYGVWRDALLVSTREFAGASFAGVGAYAINRAQLIAGNPAPQVISFLVPPGTTAWQIGDGLLPADVDGPTLPPVGSPGYFVGSADQGGPYGAPADVLTLWKLTFNFANPAASTFVRTHTIPTSNFDTIFDPCSGRSCIPQPGTANRLDILSYRQRPMHRLAYRNFGTHEAMVTNQSVEAVANMAGIRWWEIRGMATTPVVHQEGTYAPGATDGIHRWMGSIAMDSSGNMALGYSASNATLVFPSVRYTGRLVVDPAGTMPQGEGVIVDGTGSQTGSQRWGDYTSMNVDPVDDCTFWFVNQWVPTTSSAGWQLRVGRFRFAECGSPTFVATAAQALQNVCAGTPADYPLSFSALNGYSSALNLSATGLPPSAAATFTPNPVPSLPGSSVLRVATTGVAAGNYPFIASATGTGPITRTVDLTLGVQTTAPAAASLTAPANNATNQPVSPSFTWSAVPNALDYTIQVASEPTFSAIVGTATTTATSWTPAAPLATSSVYYWRVFSRNACSAPGDNLVFRDGFELTGGGPGGSPISGTVSATRTFSTAAAPGDCPLGSTPTTVLSQDFEGAATGWVQEGAAGGGVGTNTWAITTNFPFAGARALQGTTPPSVSDQRFLSPTVVLPTVGNGLFLSFQSRQQMEANGTTGCYDGGLIEVSVGGGAYTQITTGLLTDPYNGPISASFSNPAAGLQAWCGDPQPYLNSVINLAPYAGQSVRFRFRVTSDTSVGRAEGWNIDNVLIRRCN
jgi:hypothetical protein